MELFIGIPVRTLVFVSYWTHAATSLTKTAGCTDIYSSALVFTACLFTGLRCLAVLVDTRTLYSYRCRVQPDSWMLVHELVQMLCSVMLRNTDTFTHTDAVFSRTHERLYMSTTDAVFDCMYSYCCLRVRVHVLVRYVRCSDVPARLRMHLHHDHVRAPASDVSLENSDVTHPQQVCPHLTSRRCVGALMMTINEYVLCETLR